MSKQTHTHAIESARAEILAALKETPSTIADLCARLGRSRPNVDGHLQGLHLQGLVKADPAPRRPGQPGTPPLVYRLAGAVVASSPRTFADAARALHGLSRADLLVWANTLREQWLQVCPDLAFYFEHPEGRPADRVAGGFTPPTGPASPGPVTHGQETEGCLLDELDLGAIDHLLGDDEGP